MKVVGRPNNGSRALEVWGGNVKSINFSRGREQTKGELKEELEWKIAPSSHTANLIIVQCTSVLNTICMSILFHCPHLFLPYDILFNLLFSTKRSVCLVQLLLYNADDWSCDSWTGFM